MRFDYWQKFEEDSFYHIYNRGINGEEIFKSDKNYKYFLQRWESLIQPYFDLTAFCLMPNHFHFLVRVRSVTEDMKSMIRKEKTVRSIQFLEGGIDYNEFLEDQFKRLFSSYVLGFNKQNQRFGSLLQKRFKRVKLGVYRIWYLLTYIHHNPIHHRFATSYEEWPYSSYKDFIGTAAFDKIHFKGLIRDEILAWFSTQSFVQAKQKFIQLHKEFKVDKENQRYQLE